MSRFRSAGHRCPMGYKWTRIAFFPEKSSKERPFFSDYFVNGGELLPLERQKIGELLWL